MASRAPLSASFGGSTQSWRRLAKVSLDCDPEMQNCATCLNLAMHIRISGSFSEVYKGHAAGNDKDVVALKRYGVCCVVRRTISAIHPIFLLAQIENYQLKEICSPSRRRIHPNSCPKRILNEAMILSRLG